VLYRDTKDGSARTSQADIARRAGVSKRTVIRCLRRLERRGLVVVAARGGPAKGPSRYRVKPFEKVR
jgi:Mn-dependent DtxR family transcriptional regulator